MSGTSKPVLPIYIWVLLAAIGLTALLLLLVPSQEEVSPELLPWNSQYTKDNHLQALGLTLEASTVADAEKLFGKDIEVQIFSKKDESNKTAEIYFPFISIAAITGSLTATLDVPEETLNVMYSRGVKTTVNSLGNRQVTPVSSDAKALLEYKIKNLTLVPKKQLTERGVKLRFGEPDRVTKNNDGSTRWVYVNKGVEIILNPDGPDALQYYRVQ
ncbi:MAG: hypothetical protein JXR47_04085 [Thiotrichales bacterium]|jgi:hypothetical protein|nr:hypothetical protein [Thiotrichales bacterium]